MGDERCDKKENVSSARTQPQRQQNQGVNPTTATLYRPLHARDFLWDHEVQAQELVPQLLLWKRWLLLCCH